MKATIPDLLNDCIKAVTAFDPTTQSLDIYINEFLKFSQIEDDDDWTFVEEIFSGVFRYPNILAVVIDGFYAKIGQHVLRSEKPLYEVLSYLALFRLDDIGVDNYKNIIMMYDIGKMYKFTSVLFNEKNIITWMKCEWCKHYDEEFVRETILKPLLQHLPALEKLVTTLRLYTQNKIPYQKETLPVTEFKAFKLAKGRPRKIPMPEVIPQMDPHKPAPPSTYKQPAEFDRLAEEKIVNRRKAESGLMESSKKQFQCATFERSAKAKERMQEIEQAKDALCDFERFRANEKPDMGKDVTFKLNTAAILREGQRYKEREAITIKQLNKLEAGYHDVSAFLHWQTQEREKEHQQNLVEIERKRYIGKLSYEEAILAKQNLVEINKQNVVEMKQQAAELMKEYLEKRLKEEQVMRQLVETIADGHKNAKEAKAKLKQYKQKLVQEMNEETKELMKKALEQAEEEMKKRLVLISEIRAMEANPSNRTKLVDLASPAGHGLLDEMSIVELRERLCLLKEQTVVEIESKRDEILNDKTTKQQELINTIGIISKHRDEMARASAKRLEDRTNNQKAIQKSDQAMEFERELMELKQKRKEMQERQKIVPSKNYNKRNEQLQKERGIMEINRWRDLETRKKRIAKLTSEGRSTIHLDSFDNSSQKPRQHLTFSICP